MHGSSMMMMSPRFMEVINEEDESNAAKMSLMHLDLLSFALTGNFKHDSTLLKQSFKKLKYRVDSRVISKHFAQQQFEQLKDKTDALFSQHQQGLNESDAETLSELCQDINLLNDVITKLFDEQISDAKFDLTNSLEYSKKTHGFNSARQNLDETTGGGGSGGGGGGGDHYLEGSMSVPSELSIEKRYFVNKPKNIEVKRNPFFRFNEIACAVTTAAAVEVIEKEQQLQQVKSQSQQYTIQVNDMAFDKVEGKSLCFEEDRKPLKSAPAVDEVIQNNGSMNLNQEGLQLVAENTIVEPPVPTAQFIKTNNQVSERVSEEIRVSEERERIRQWLNDRMQRIQELFHEKLLDDVGEEMHLVDTEIEKIKQNGSNKFDDIIHEFHQVNEKDLSYYKDLCKELANSVKLLGQKEGWKLEQDSGGFSIQYKLMEGSKMIALRVESANLAVELKTLIAILYEIELYTKWLPFCKHGQNLKTVDRACKVVHMQTSPPLISDREFFVHGMGVDRLHRDGSIFILGRSIDKDPEFLRELDITLPKQGKSVRVDIPFLTFQIKPQADKKITLSLLANFDAHLKFVPDSVINLVVRKFAKFMFNKMLEQQKKFKGSQWEKNVNNNPAFYNWIDDKVNSFLTTKQ